LLKKLNAGDYAGAAAELLRWDKVGGKVLPGLAKRRKAEMEIFLG
jgi:GH24 family phage-related lysozyme (muramidase)